MTTAAQDLVQQLRCQVVLVALGAGPAPAQVIAALAHEPNLVALTGEWAGGGAVVSCAPFSRLEADGDAVAAIAAQPVLSGVRTEDFIGGGWFGWFGHDAAPRLAFYDHVLRHRDGQWWFEALWSEQREAPLGELLDRYRPLIGDCPKAAASWRVGPFGGASMPAHLDAVERAVEWIRAGEVYQVNVCTRLVADFAGDPAALFADATQRLSPRFGGYAADDDRSVACLSPELFLRRRGRAVITSPIKGTAARVGDVGSDELRDSVKDIAENVMIVDLMRNDLGRVCETGSVRPAALLQIEPHPGVWHLVSTVAGTLRDDVTDAQLLRATLPPGSVTGAPKLRALEAIAQLEGTPRGVYTGVFGFAAPSWGLEFAVAIRTFEIEGGRIALGVGGGVTADSVPMREWRECLDKARPLVAAVGSKFEPALVAPSPEPSDAQREGGLLETVLVMDSAPVRLGDHLARLDRSAREIYGHGVPIDTADRARNAARQEAPARGVLRMVMTPDGQVAVSVGAMHDADAAHHLHVVHGRAGLWRHKWADRSELAAAERSATAPLFVADDGSVLETSRGNVFLICPDGSLRTPPLRDDLLPGITRRAVLDLARDGGRATRLEAFTVDQLRGHAAFWTSSLSGAVAIDSIDGSALPRRDEDVAWFGSRLTGFAGGGAQIR